MAHYVQAMVDAFTEGLTDQEIGFYYRWKRRLDRGEFVLNGNHDSKINVLDLLWQDYERYDQLGHAIIAFNLWFGVVGHPKTRSQAVWVGKVPFGDKAVQENNKALSDLGGFYKAEVWGGNFEQDGAIYPQAESPFLNRRNIPLEIGSVAPASLAHEFHLYGCFARWPYDSKWLYIFDMPEIPKEFVWDDLLHSHWDACKECLKDHWFEDFSFLLPKK